MKKSFILLILAFLSLTTLFAQNEDKNDQKLQTPQGEVFGVPSELQTKINTFFKLLFEKKYEEAYDDLLVNSPLKEKAGSIEQLIKETKRISKFYGSLKGYEIVTSEAATKSYIRVRCLGICDEFPMRWLFTYYQSPKHGWIITNVKFDDLSEYFFTD